MDKKKHVLIFALITAACAYALFYFNYFHTPTGDFIGNFRLRVVEYLNGHFPGSYFKIMPAYTLLLTFMVKFFHFKGDDPIYTAALLFNIVLYVPYLIIVYKIYKRFLFEHIMLAAYLFLTVNIYTVYIATNAELEMALTLLIVLSIHLSLIGSKLAYIPAFFAAITKWDAAFIIPAAMFKDFFYRKQRIITIILGGLAGTGLVAWLALSLLNSGNYGNPYVQEIASRGPNIYRYIIDCFLTASGILPWMITHGYFSPHIHVTVVLFSGVALFGVPFVAAITWGGIIFFKKHRKEAAPIVVFIAGFLLIHMIYQNTKDRYVLPILWFLNLLFFIGLTEGLYPWGKKNITGKWNPSLKKHLTIVITAIFLALTLFVLYQIQTSYTLGHLLFALLFIALSTIIIMRKITTEHALHASISSLFICLLVFYGVRTMDHISNRRVEFKQVGLWYKKNSKPNNILFIAENIVTEYYAQLGDPYYIIPRQLKSATFPELVKELKANKVTYVFVDDFYRKRYRYGDKNAIEKKAQLFQYIYENGEKSGQLKLIKTFHSPGGILSYLYKINY